MQESKQHRVIYPVVRLTTKACLLHIIEVGHKWLELATKACLSLVLKSREWTLEVRGDFLAAQDGYKPPKAATQVGKLKGDA
jgi:hypothetical protein